MEFGSITFITLFFPLFILAYFISRGRMKIYVTLIFGFVFYYWNSGSGIIVLLSSILINYFTGKSIEKSAGEKKSKFLLRLGIGVNILILIYFKYLTFFFSSLMPFLHAGTIAGKLTIAWFPAGISFYTFVAISYLTDIYRGNCNALFRISDTALLFSFFPKVLAGPITMFKSFSPVLTGKQKLNYDIDGGLRRVLYGLAKKVIVADHLIDLSGKIFSITAVDLTFRLSWLGAISYTLAIYLDFSGYSDIAIGIGKMLGYRIPENFNFPYISKSIKEFWKRWHITLSNWLQTYLFLPMAYSFMRKIKNDTVVGMKTENFAYIAASFLTMSICGLWHGASWIFVIWGSFHGTLLVCEHLFMRKFMKRRKYKLLKWIYAQSMIITGWVIFRSESVAYAYEFLRSMTGFSTGTGKVDFFELYFNSYIAFLLVLGILISSPLSDLLKRKITGYSGPGKVLIFLGELVWPVLIFIVSMIEISSGTFNPFIYFRF